MRRPALANRLLPIGINTNYSLQRSDRRVTDGSKLMNIDLEAILSHDNTEECVACRAQEMVSRALVPAAEAWETSAGLPRFAMALHGAAGLLGIMLEAGVSREEIEGAVSRLLQDLESQIAEDRAFGGPAQGTA